MKNNSQNNNKPPIIELLEDIKDLFYDNDIECTERGSEILERLENILYDLQSGQPG